MKKLVAALNALLIIFLLINAKSKGFPGPNDSEFLLVTLAFSAPISTLLLLLGSSDLTSWLGLYFQRKAAEEKKRIRELGS
jgi:hypothetical protein